MLKNASSNGYSSQVRGWIVIDGIRHELAQVGPDFCITRKPIDIVFASPGELVVEIDGDQQVTPIRLRDGQSTTSIRIKFDRI